MRKDPFKRYRAGIFLLKSAWGTNRLTLAIVLVLCSLSTPAQVELRADSNRVETGNPLALHLRIPAELGKPDSLNFESWNKVLPVQNIIAQTAWRKEGQFFIKSITALFFDEDSLQIPGLPIVFQNGDTLVANPLQIQVTATPSPDDLNDMAPIKDIHREPTHWIDYLPWILGGLGVLALLGWMFWWANRSPKSTLQSRIISTPPHELALKKLDVLTNKQLISTGLVKEHYAELTYLLREYLDKQFGIRTLESTTAETMRQLEASAYPPSLLHALQTLLEHADLAKFAKTYPPDSFHNEAIDLARKIILETHQTLDSPITH